MQCFLPTSLGRAKCWEPDYFDVMVDRSFTYDQVDDMWNVDYSRVIENQLDVSHLAFVHHNTIGRGGTSVSLRRSVP